MTGLYTIPLFGLGEGKHTFEFEAGNKFFDGFEESEIKEGYLNAIVRVVKGESYINLKILISGRVRISCNRCLELYWQDIECENNIGVKVGPESDESDPEFLIVPAGSNELDLSQLFYEYIHLALPIRRIHPDDKEGNCGCNPEMIARLNSHLAASNKSTNLRELDKLLNNN